MYGRLVGQSPISVGELLLMKQLRKYYSNEISGSEMLNL